MTNAGRKLAIVGVVGLAVLGGGAYVVTDRLVDDKSTANSEPGVLAPEVPSASASVQKPKGVEPVPSVTPKKSAVTPSASASASASATSAAQQTGAAQKTKAQRIADARAAAAKPNTQVRRPLPPAHGVNASAVGVTVRNSGSLKKDGVTMRVVSARRDLTGYRELGWIAGAGERVGAAECTSTVRFSPGMPAAERPTLLLCWRTSSAKSVYTVAVTAAGRPAKADSVATLDKQWNSMG